MNDRKLRLINRKQLQEKLGGIGERTVSRYTKDGRIPKPTRIGYKLYWIEQVIDEWIAAGCPTDWDTNKEVI